MTIKPIKSDKNESDVPGQHRECLNKISSPKSPVSICRLDRQRHHSSHNNICFVGFFKKYFQSTQHGIEPRSGLRNANYGVDDVVVNRHRRTNQKRFVFISKD